VLLDGDCAETEVSRDARDGAGVVRLDPADRDERVAARGQCVRDEVLELANLVAAEGDAGVAVLALGPDLDPSTQGRTQAWQRMHGRQPEQERDARKVVEAHPGTVATCGLGDRSGARSIAMARGPLATQKTSRSPGSEPAKAA